LIQQLVDDSDGFIPFNKDHLHSHAESVDSSGTASNRIKEIKDNWDWYRSTGLLKGWYYFNYRKVRVGRWSEVITTLPPEELKERLEIMSGVDIEVRSFVSVSLG